MKITKTKVNKMKVEAVAKLLMLLVMLILLFFISDRFVDYLITIDVAVLKKAVYVILATGIVGIYTTERKENKEE